MERLGLVEPVPVLSLLEIRWVEVALWQPPLLVEELSVVLKAGCLLGSGPVGDSHLGIKEEVSS